MDPNLKNGRLGRELTKLVHSYRSGISVTIKNESLSVLEAQITGPPDTPYENGTFTLELLVSDSYPFNPPNVRFLTKVYHPNIDTGGRICLDLLKAPPNGTWSPGYTIDGLLIAIQMLLGNPNPDDPLMAGIAEEYKRDRTEFEKKARMYTKTYAC